MKQETQSYLRTYYENKQDMTFKKNDLAVFQFMLVLTKCKTGAAAFTQLDAQGKKRTANMCNTEQGVVFDFEDKKAQRELERMMTPSARAAVRQILGVMDMARAKEGAALRAVPAASSPSPRTATCRATLPRSQRHATSAPATGIASSRSGRSGRRASSRAAVASRSGGAG